MKNQNKTKQNKQDLRMALATVSQCFNVACNTLKLLENEVKKQLEIQEIYKHLKK